MGRSPGFLTGGTHLLLQHESLVSILIGRARLELLLEALDSLLLLGELLVVRRFLLQQALHRARGDGEGRWGRHFDRNA